MIRATIILCALCASVVQSPAAPLDAERLADQIRKVEDFRNHDGTHGERGPYQITRGVWDMQMPGIPFALARQEGPARACALKHIAWLRTQLVAADLDDNAHTVALAYNAGLTAVLTGKAPMSSYDYALRVQRLYDLSRPPLNAVSMRTTLDAPAAKPREARPSTFKISP